MTEFISRRPGEEIIIGPDISVRVNHVSSTRAVELAVTRPARITVFRRELVDAMPSLVPWFRRRELEANMY
jgi:sRNA-binding carbon storage regulator CsrA